MKKIVALLPGAFDSVGGIQSYNRLLIKACSELADVAFEALILNDRPQTADSRYYNGSAQVRSFGRNKLKFAASATAAVAHQRPDLLIVGHVHFAPLALWMRGVSPGTEHWYIAHGVDVWHRRNAVTRFALNRAEKILSVSDYTQRELIRFNSLSGENCAKLPCALDPLWTDEFDSAAARSAQPSAPVLLTCARLDAVDRYKGVDQAIRAVARVASKVPGLRYVIIGDGDNRPSLETLAHQLGISDRVEFRGNVTQNELAEAYESCSLFLMPSRKEGFGIVFLEAAFFGKPSIGGLHGGTPEVIEDGRTGWLVENGDDETLAALLATILMNREATIGAGAAARKRLEQRFLFASFKESLRAMFVRGAA